MAGLKVLFIGGTRYAEPLTPTQEKKIKALAGGLDMSFIGFHTNRGRAQFHAHGDFYLVSSRIFNYVRQAYFLLFAFFKGSFLIKHKNIFLVVCQSPFEGVAGAWLKKRFPSVKLIIEIHGEWDRAPSAYGRLPLKLKWLSDGVGAWALRRCDALRVISKTTEATVRRFNKPIFSFPTYTDIEIFLEAPGHDVIPNRFVFVGQMVRLKGVDTLIDALALLRDKGIPVELLLVGEGNDAPRFKAKVKALGLEEACRFLGNLDQQELAKLIKSSLALVLPSWTEGFGRVIIEAFACARPVVGTRAGAIPELISHGETGFLVEPGHCEELAARLEDLFSHPGEAAHMGLSGRMFVEKMFSTGKYVDNYIDMLSTVQEGK